MFIKKIAFYMTLLSALSAIPVWAVGEPAGEVIDIIESEKPLPAKNDAAEKAERITAARRAAALKKAEEKAAAEKMEKERVDALKAAEELKKAEEKAAADKKVQEQSAAQKAAEEGKAAESAGVKNARLAAENELKSKAPEQKPGSPVQAAVSTENSWWGSFTDMVGLTDSDPGVTVQPVSSNIGSPVSEYIIGPGDLIGISVWRDENLTRTVVVLPDGKITFPLLGELVAEGKTVAKLKLELETALSRYTADSNVTVEVKQSNSMIIYVTGRVNAPGRQLMVANTNVLQALSMAGGPNPFAQKSKIKIFRQHGKGTDMFPFNYNEVIEGRHLETNIELKRGDVIIVP